MRTISSVLTWVVVAASSALGQSVAPPDSAAVTAAKQGIDESHVAYIKAFGDGNIDEVLAVYDPTATELLPHGRVVRGLDELRGYWSDWIKHVGPIKLTLTRDEFWLVGDRAFETGKYITGYKDKNGKDAAVGGNFAIQWTHESDGSWKILTPFDTPQ